MRTLRSILLSLVCLFGSISHAAPLFLDFSSYPDGTPLSSVSFPGVTFEATPGVTVAVRNIPGVQNGLWIKTSVPGADFKIKTSGPMTASTFTANGFGSCQVPPGDSIKWYKGLDLVDSFLTFVAGPGRCSTTTLHRTFSHDVISFDIIDPNNMMVLDITLDFVPDSPQSIPTFSEWGLIILSLLLALGTFVVMRRKQS
jgi:hypothetical protein